MADTDAGWCVFASAIGPLGLAWGPQGLRGAQLPERDDDVVGSATRARMARRFARLDEARPPPRWQRLVQDLQALMDGAAVDLSATDIDWTGVPGFHRRVYELALAIPPGRTRSYGQLAAALGEPGAARAVGQALGANPFAPVVPCHRVLAAQGPGGFSAPGGLPAKFRLLAIEQARPPSPEGQQPLF